MGGMGGAPSLGPIQKVESAARTLETQTARLAPQRESNAAAFSLAAGVVLVLLVLGLLSFGVWKAAQPSPPKPVSQTEQQTEQQAEAEKQRRMGIARTLFPAKPHLWGLF